MPRYNKQVEVAFDRPSSYPVFLHLMRNCDLKVWDQTTRLEIMYDTLLVLGKELSHNQAVVVFEPPGSDLLDEGWHKSERRGKCRGVALGSVVAVVHMSAQKGTE